MTMNASKDEAVPRHTTAILAIILISYFISALTAGIVLLALCLIAALALIRPAELAGRRRDTRGSGLPAPPEPVLAAATRD